MTRLGKIAVVGLAACFLMACSDEDLAHFYSEGPGTWTPVDQGGAYSAAYQPARCYQTSASYQTCFN